MRWLEGGESFRDYSIAASPGDVLVRVSVDCNGTYIPIREENVTTGQFIRNKAFGLGACLPFLVAILLIPVFGVGFLLLLIVLARHAKAVKQQRADADNEHERIVTSSKFQAWVRGEPFVTS